ncbi:MAG TPA: hypothetical protein VF734_16620 [Pseudonocardiaceae bacterium]
MTAGAGLQRPYRWRDGTSLAAVAFLHGAGADEYNGVVTRRAAECLVWLNRRCLPLWNRL